MFYRFARFVVRGFLRLAFRWRVEGVENLPASGPAILAGNHFHWLDPPVVGCSVNRQVHFMAKEEFFESWLGRLVGRRLGAFPVKRHTADRAALRTAVKHLEAGHVFGIFPEGTRSKSGTLLKPEPGVAWIAIRAKSPVIPVAVKGSYKLFSPLEVRIGKPIDLSPYYGQKLTSALLEQVSDQLMAEVAQLLAEIEGRTA